MSFIVFDMVCLANTIILPFMVVAVNASAKKAGSQGRFILKLRLLLSHVVVDVTLGAIAWRGVSVGRFATLQNSNFVSLQTSRTCQCEEDQNQLETNHFEFLGTVLVGSR